MTLSTSSIAVVFHRIAVLSVPEDTQNHYRNRWQQKKNRGLLLVFGKIEQEASKGKSVLFSQIEAAYQYDTVPPINDEEALDFFSALITMIWTLRIRSRRLSSVERVGRAKVPTEAPVITERSALSTMTAAKAMHRRLVMTVIRRTLEEAQLTVEVVEEDMGDWRRRRQGGGAAGTGRGCGRGGGRTTGAGREGGGGWWRRGLGRSEKNSLFSVPPTRT